MEKAEKIKEILKKDEEADPHVGRVEVLIDLGMTSNAIVFNGVKFYHGRKYWVKPTTAHSLLEIMYRTKWHDREALGREKTENAYRAHNTIVLNKSGAFLGK